MKTQVSRASPPRRTSRSAYRSTVGAIAPPRPTGAAALLAFGILAVPVLLLTVVQAVW
ncbi:hypothetical protein [Sagittula salina]|uniref:Uncharacterized protein n=1 Tax=Sagittula salina TaxID=2820268 RepID=A0A940MMY5_9RHOB|nr:hypothetical protein [Sagittula salina]MBP0480972.1 hypothetical protein [Sagittula salina]